MILLIGILQGAAVGAILMAALGVAAITLSRSNYVKGDRRLWWTLAAIISALCVMPLALSESAGDPTRVAYFQSMMMGWMASAAIIWFVGFIVLCFVGRYWKRPPLLS